MFNVFISHIVWSCRNPINIFNAKISFFLCFLNPEPLLIQVMSFHCCVILWKNPTSNVFIYLHKIYCHPTYLLLINYSCLVFTFQVNVVIKSSKMREVVSWNNWFIWILNISHDWSNVMQESNSWPLVHTFNPEKNHINKKS